jgi:hypothetical protein
LQITGSALHLEHWQRQYRTAYIIGIDSWTPVALRQWWLQVSTSTFESRKTVQLGFCRLRVDKGRGHLTLTAAWGTRRTSGSPAKGALHSQLALFCLRHVDPEHQPIKAPVDQAVKKSIIPKEEIPSRKADQRIIDPKIVIFRSFI